MEEVASQPRAKAQAKARKASLAETAIDVAQAAPAAIGPIVAAPAAEFNEAVTSPAVESDGHQAEQDMPAALKEGNEVMATVESTVESGVDKAQANFGEMGARFKTAFEKSSKVGEEMVDFAKGNVEAMVASARVAAKHGEVLGQEAVDYGKKSLEHTMAMFRGVASVKSPTELFQLQSDYAKTSFDSVVAEVSKLSESMLKIAGDVAQPLSSRYAVAAEKIKTAAL